VTWRILKAADAEAVMRKGGSARIDADLAARFRPGDAIVARNINPPGHTRVPRYVRGRRGRIDRDHGVFIFPDDHARDGTQTPQHCYSVKFSGRELWGPDAEENHFVYLDLFDDYLDPA